MLLLFALIVVIAASFLTASAASPFYNSSTTGSLAGVDVSTLTSSSTASCFVSSGISFIIPRGFKSSGTIDSNVCDTLTNSKNAGIPHRDVYLFPCPTCTTKTADDQVMELVNYLNTNCKSSWSGRVWLDIEGSQYWLGDYTKNKAFYQGMIDSCKNRGYTCGVYASSSQWSAIFGSTSYAYNPQALPLVRIFIHSLLPFAHTTILYFYFSFIFLVILILIIYFTIESSGTRIIPMFHHSLTLQHSEDGRPLMRNNTTTPTHFATKVSTITTPPIGAIPTNPRPPQGRAAI